MSDWLVESIPLIVERIDGFFAAGSAYRVDDDVYFSTASDPAFGSIGSYDQQQMVALFADRGGDPERSGKKDPLDPLLWQAQRPGEPAWDTSLGHGRPGWHIECTAIALHYLGTDFDIQGGGSDLIPHHEMGASQAHQLTRKTVRLTLRPHRNGRAWWREDVEVEGQPGLRLAAAR